MSLIEEALRRVQDPLLKTTKAATQPARQGAKPSTPATVGGTTVSAPSQEIAAAAPTPTKAHSWPMTPPGETMRLSSAPNNLLAVVPIAVFAFTIALILGGSFWFGRTLGWGTTRAPTISPPRSSTPSITQPATPLPHQPPTPMPSSPLSTLRQARPGSGSQSPRDEFVLSGVVEGLGNPYAVINGAIVSVGEQVQGATLIRVANGMVTLRRTDGTELVLRVSR